MNHSKRHHICDVCWNSHWRDLASLCHLQVKGLRESWCSGGPPGTRFGRRKSGWMDCNNFKEWFLSIIVPWACGQEGGKKHGDNLSSHLSPTLIDKQCTAGHRLCVAAAKLN
ncbi:hypothetical protein PoB_001383900 [Plakobranchus ocellatus]|uniref:Uncharacterized protein n=1 Tax=Plakobranchus ocellatus TaxID=259542 RepID=A0AAV3YYY5_9GAST|nr:hypothetical protein PoB_001383900 [Plakobranchus ocellatus]